MRILNLVKFSLPAAAALMLTGCASAPPPPPPMSDQEHASFMAVSDSLIIPGVRVGPVFLGMTEADLYKKLGDPSGTNYINLGSTTYGYRPLGISAIVNNTTHIVDDIVVGSPSYSTDGGFHLGSSVLQMKETLGDHEGVADYLHEFWYPAGIVVQFDPNGNVSGIQVTFSGSTGRERYY